ncbi:M48 family metalloprotease [bacterium]|nr:M48 family metalloprotease [bacterium]
MIASILVELSSHPIVNALGWTLAYFTWQAILVAAIVAIALELTKRFPSQWQYAISCCGLLAMVAIAVGTFSCLVSNPDTPSSSGLNRSIDRAIATDGEPAEAPIAITAGRANLPADPGQLVSADANRLSVESDTASTGLAGGWSGTFRSFLSTLQNSLPFWVVVWICGVTLLALRLLFGMNRVRQWRRDSVEVDEKELVSVVDQLLQRMNIRREVRLLKSARAMVPAVIGCLKPAILLPASMISGLPTAELESILAHELAHIRRHDYLVNLLQTIVETILFFHPAIWWLSHQIRIQREHCCDDVAISVSGDRVVFVKALKRLEEIRCQQDQLVMAATGGSLVQRIQRIVHGKTKRSPYGRFAGLAVLALLAAGLWGSQVLAEPSTPVQNIPIASNALENDDNEEEYNTHKGEILKTDSKTGIEKYVVSDIKLSAGNEQVEAEMIYSNVLMYSFIPSHIAEKLGAVEVGEIEFNKPAELDGLFPQLLTADQSTSEALEQITVNELIEANSKVKVVPYDNDPTWAPGHLGGYGMNKIDQRVFKIVRIDKVDLGIGLKFGPINALVLDDQNSDFGVLGRDWAQQVRGSQGETLWWHAADNSFRLETPPIQKQETDPEPNNSKATDDQNTQQETSPNSGGMTVRSSGYETIDPRVGRPDIRVLKTHTYDSPTRESTGWISINGARQAIDVGVEHNDVTVYLTLLHEIAAVDANNEFLWNQPWSKTEPRWQTISIVELNLRGEKTLAVELFAHEGPDKLTYRYVLLATGERLPDQDPTEPTPENDQELADRLQFRIVADRRTHNDICELSRQRIASGNLSEEVLSENDGAEGRILLAKWVGLARVHTNDPDSEEAVPFKFLPTDSHVIRNGRTGELIDINDSLENVSNNSERSAKFSEWCQEQEIGDVQILVIQPPQESQDVNGSHLDSVRKGTDHRGSNSIDFTLNPEGGNRMLSLTSLNAPDAEHHYLLGIVLDGKLQTAPRILGSIQNRGVIEGRFTDDEVEAYLDLLTPSSNK